MGSESIVNIDAVFWWVFRIGPPKMASVSLLVFLLNHKKWGTPQKKKPISPSSPPK